MIKHIVEHLEQSTRLDRYLKTLMPNITQGVIEKSIRDGKIKVDNFKTSSSLRISSKFSINIDDALKLQYGKIIKNARPLVNHKLLDIVRKLVIFEDDNLIVLNKPSGICCQGGSKLSNSLDQIMNEIYSKQVRIVHRLDRDTTGIMLFAKNLKYAQILSQLFRENKIKKTYHAISEYTKSQKSYTSNKYFNQIVNKEMILLSAPLSLGQMGGEDKIFVDYDSTNKAESLIKLMEVLSGGLFLFEIKPQTGRKHQIRVHLQHLCFPILGDDKYNYSKSVNKLMLNSSRIEIPDLNLNFECDMPAHFQKYL